MVPSRGFAGDVGSRSAHNGGLRRGRVGHDQVGVIRVADVGDDDLIGRLTADELFRRAHLGNLDARLEHSGASIVLNARGVGGTGNGVWPGRTVFGIE